RHTRFSRDWSSDVCSSDLFDRVSRAPAVIAGLKDDRAESAEDVRREIAQAHERAREVFASLATVVDPRAQEDRVRITPGLRASRSEERRVGKERRARLGPR